MIVTATVNARSAARALQGIGYAVLLAANVTRPPLPKRIDLQAIVADDDAVDQLSNAGWDFDDEPLPPSADAGALHDLIVACLVGDVSLARALATRAFDHDSDIAAIEAALQFARRAA